MLSILDADPVADSDQSMHRFEQVVRAAGLGPVAGADEAGRGACAGPLVAAAVVLGQEPSNQIIGLKDSKLLSPSTRNRLYDQILAKARAVAWVRVEHDECDRLGMQVADIQGLRRAVARLEIQPGFVLTDGFPVDGLGLPNLGMWKGDRVAACIAAASIVAKVTRDRIMISYADQYPEFNFAGHKGYCTAAHQRELERHGACEIHRRSFANVVRAGRVGGR